MVQVMKPYKGPYDGLGIPIREWTSVKELIDKLQEFPEDLPVMLQDGDTYYIDVFYWTERNVVAIT